MSRLCGIAVQAPQLQVLDGLAPSEEELAEAQQFSEAEAEAVPAPQPESVGGGPEWCRITLALGQLKNHQESRFRKLSYQASCRPAVGSLPLRSC